MCAVGRGARRGVRDIFYQEEIGALGSTVMSCTQAQMHGCTVDPTLHCPLSLTPSSRHQKSGLTPFPRKSTGIRYSVGRSRFDARTACRSCLSAVRTSGS